MRLKKRRIKNWNLVAFCPMLHKKPNPINDALLGGNRNLLK
jgi:hypothetical protein